MPRIEEIEAEVLLAGDARELRLGPQAGLDQVARIATAAGSSAEQD